MGKSVDHFDVATWTPFQSSGGVQQHRLAASCHHAAGQIVVNLGEQVDGPKYEIVSCLLDHGLARER